VADAKLCPADQPHLLLTERSVLTCASGERTPVRCRNERSMWAAVSASGSTPPLLRGAASILQTSRRCTWLPHRSCCLYQLNLMRPSKSDHKQHVRRLMPSTTPFLHDTGPLSNPAPAAELAAVAAAAGQQRLSQRRGVRQALQHRVHEAGVAQVLQASTLQENTLAGRCSRLLLASPHLVVPLYMPASRPAGQDSYEAHHPLHCSPL
jgi:hypothetical protein